MQCILRAVVTCGVEQVFTQCDCKVHLVSKYWLSVNFSSFRLLKIENATPQNETYFWSTHFYGIQNICEQMLLFQLFCGILKFFSFMWWDAMIRKEQFRFELIATSVITRSMRRLLSFIHYMYVISRSISLSFRVMQFYLFYTLLFICWMLFESKLECGYLKKNKMYSDSTNIEDKNKCTNRRTHIFVDNK